MTPEEELLWSVLRRNGLSGLHFRRQQVIAGFIVDFFCHELRFFVELDGDVHSSQLQYDAQRDWILLQLGFEVLRFDNWLVRQNLPRILEVIFRH